MTIKINNVKISEEEFGKIAKQQGFVKKVTNKRWRAEEGGKFYMVAVDGTIGQYIEMHDDFCDAVYASGNYFKTEKEAQAYWDRKLAKQRVVDRLGELEGDWEVVWNDYDRRAYKVWYDHTSNNLGVDWNTSMGTNHRRNAR